jgi:phospholipid/cholesterol/gamma-HCH transport system substrate-binding protein
MKLSKEAKIGLIVVTGIALLFWGVNYLKGRDFFSSQKKLYAIYNEIGGLAPSNPVTMNGMKIGLVRTIKMLNDTAGRILVTMIISDDVHIPKNSIALINSPDLLSGKTVSILRGNSPESTKNGDTLVSDIEKNLMDAVNDQVSPIKARAESILSSFDSVLAVVRNVFNESTKENLKRSFESIANSLVSIESVTGSLDTILSKQGKMREIFESLSSITTNLKNNNEKISAMIGNFSAISDTLAKSNISATLDNTRKTLEQTSSLFQKINRGEGTMGQLATNDSLYHNLNATAKDLDELLKDFNDNPKRYIGVSLISFGGSGKKTKKK